MVGRVLVVEDDEEIADVLRRSLRQEGHEVRTAVDGERALALARDFVPDLVVLDLGLPKLDGVEVCRRLRADSDVPILILTARSGTDDRVRGLDAGADDYLVKPFERAELLARLRALMRRRPPRGSASLRVSDVSLNPDTREVTRGGRQLDLTAREFELLEFLMRNQKLVISRERLLEEVWGYDPTSMTNTIDVFISNLRRKLEEGGEARVLHTKRGRRLRRQTVNPVRPLMAKLRRQPVRTRLAIFSGTLTAVILIAFAVVVGRLVSNRIEADFRDELQGTANGLAVAWATASLTNGDLDQIAMANHAEIRITGRSGAVQYQTADAPAFGEPEPGQIKSVGGSLRVASQLIATNDLGGALYVQYARSRANVDATIGRLQLFLGGGVLIGILLAVFAGMTVANRAMQPIAALTGTARRIASTRDPSIRIPQPESDDEVAELAQTLEEMLRELDAARTETELTVQRQREFVADASHELRTPLTSILANLELLEGSMEDGEEDERAAARSALRSSRRMSRLVADLLILARADAGRREEPADCDLSVIACEAFEEVRPVAGDRRLTADVEPGAALCGNADELHRMILNLLENAVRHTPAGSEISLSLRLEGGNALIEVDDDGPGLPEAMREQVFERFVRGMGPADRQPANGEGTGLGLSIVRAVATAHRGEVRAERSERGGARFVVTLPLDGEPAPAGS